MGTTSEYFVVPKDSIQQKSFELPSFSCGNIVAIATRPGLKIFLFPLAQPYEKEKSQSDCEIFSFSSNEFHNVREKTTPLDFLSKCFKTVLSLELNNRIIL